MSTDKQDEKSLADQIAYCREFLQQLTGLPCHIHVIQSQGSGEHLDRDELRELESLVEQKTWDLVICEDLGRICRRLHAVLFCELCEDCDTRAIAINDDVDTAEENWRQESFFAAMRHERYNKDTAKRIRRTHRNRFVQGGTLPKRIFGYTLPVGAKTDDQLQKDPDAEPILREIFRRLEDGAPFTEVADWLNAQGIPPGPYCRSRQWTVHMLGRLVRNPLLKGVRVRNRKMGRRINKSGRRKAIDAPPEEWLERRCPHLAFFNEPYYDHVLLLIKQRNAGRGRPKNASGADVRTNVPRKRTEFPAQHARCGICGRVLWQASLSAGRKQATCSGGLHYQCWNAIYIDTALAQQKIAEAVLREVRAIDGFGGDFQQRLSRAVDEQSSHRDGRRGDLDRRMAKFQVQIQNLTRAIGECGGSPALYTELKATEAAAQEVGFELSQLERPVASGMAIPTLEELAGLLEEQFALMLRSDPEAQRLLSCLLPEIFIRPVELCDGRTVEPQAVLQLDLQPLANRLAGGLLPTVITPRKLVVNLFEECQYVQHALRLGTVEQRGERVIASGRSMGLSIGETMLARNLYRAMQARGAAGLWVPLTAPPDRNWNCRRHLHPRYQFVPLQGFVPPPLA
ncbi:MAG TPA: recombinase family protein [Planctomycetaceae bacterium]|nr:recombinase family protein [Planctomycetaceae bacterium]